MTDQNAAVLAILADVDICGSKAGQAYRQTLISLIEPSAKAKEALATTLGDPQPFYVALFDRSLKEKLADD